MFIGNINLKYLNHIQGNTNISLKNHFQILEHGNIHLEFNIILLLDDGCMFYLAPTECFKGKTFIKLPHKNKYQYFF